MRVGLALPAGLVVAAVGASASHLPSGLTAAGRPRPRRSGGSYLYTQHSAPWRRASPVKDGQASTPDMARVATTLQPMIAAFVIGNLVKIVILRLRLRLAAG